MMSNNNNCNNTDRLAQINDQLRDKVNVDTPWLPLESNPEIFTKFGHDVSCVLCVFVYNVLLIILCLLIPQY